MHRSNFQRPVDEPRLEAVRTRQSIAEAAVYQRRTSSVPIKCKRTRPNQPTSSEFERYRKSPSGSPIRYMVLPSSSCPINRRSDHARPPLSSPFTLFPLHTSHRYSPTVYPLVSSSPHSVCLSALVVTSRYCFSSYDLKPPMRSELLSDAGSTSMDQRPVFRQRSLVAR